MLLIDPSQNYVQKPRRGTYYVVIVEKRRNMMSTSGDSRNMELK